MKSKTVASILRHVASKITTTSVDEEPQIETSAQTSESQEKETKKSRRARKEAQEDDLGEDANPYSSQNDEEKLEMLYEKIAWPLGKTYGHPYDAFKLILTYASIQSTLGMRDSSQIILGSQKLPIQPLT